MPLVWQPLMIWGYPECTSYSKKSFQFLLRIHLSLILSPSKCVDTSPSIMFHRLKLVPVSHLPAARPESGEATQSPPHSLLATGGRMDLTWQGWDPELDMQQPQCH